MSRRCDGGYEDPPTLLIRHQGEPALALGVVRRQAAREFASPKVRFAMDSPLEQTRFRTRGPTPIASSVGAVLVDFQQGARDPLSRMWSSHHTCPFVEPSVPLPGGHTQ